MENTIEQTLDSIEVAEMVDKEHSKLLRDIRRYEKQFAEAKIGLGDFFKESIYKDANNQDRPCYRITKKGCEFIAHKLTGVKGTIFTARYINRFHEMEDILKRQQEPELPWFVRKIMGHYAVLERDFSAITGVNVRKHKLFYRMEYFTPGKDWNAFSLECTHEEFSNKYGFEFGEDEILAFLYPSGVKKGLKILRDERRVNAEAKKILLEGIRSVEEMQKPVIDAQKIQNQLNKNPVQITFILN